MADRSRGREYIGGKSWAASFEGILSKVTAGLGCGNAKVSAELYKMLVYERGGFFLAHRDTEKTAGMFGTLVVTLPSAYRGGALRIRHADKEVTVETGAADPSEISFAAFYADCEHEAMPVEEGSRVCLVYNLVQERAKGKQGVLKVPNSADSPPKIAWLLDHQFRRLSGSGLGSSGCRRRLTAALSSYGGARRSFY